MVGAVEAVALGRIGTALPLMFSGTGRIVNSVGSAAIVDVIIVVFRNRAPG
jgi:hypothetical protein